MVFLMGVFGCEKKEPAAPEVNRDTGGSAVRPADQEPGLPSDSKAVYARVNGEQILGEDVALLFSQMASMNPGVVDQMSNEQRQDAIRHTVDLLIEKRLLFQEAAKEGVTLSDEEALAPLNSLRQKFASDDEMEVFLNKGKTSVALRKISDRKGLTVRKLELQLVNRIEVSDDAILDYWESAKSSLVDDMIDARHILVKTEEEAKAVLQDLKKGESFEDMARRVSEDANSKARGGALGWVPRRVLVKPFGDAAFALKPGALSAPVKTEFGYHLILVEGIKSKEAQGLDEYREYIRQNIQRERWLRVKRKEWLVSLKEKAEIWNKLEPAS